jgi:nucleoside-diphosphate-sugar epimerase
MKVLITGATGILGGRILDAFLSDGDQVFCFARDKENVALLKGKKCTAMLFDEINIDYLKKQKIDAIIHNITVYGKNEESAREILDGNVNVMLKVIDTANKAEIKKFYYINTALDKKLSCYALAKHQAFEWLEMLYKGDIFNLRLQMLFSEKVKGSKLFIESVIEKCLNGQDVLLTQCDQKRDIMHIDDCAGFIKHIVKKTKKSTSESIDIGYGNAIVLKSVVEHIKNLTRTKSKIVYGAVQKRKDEPQEMVAVENTFKYGYVPKYTWETGIKQCIEAQKEGK